MDYKEFVMWLKENDLLDLAMNHYPFFIDLFKMNLNAKKEKILLIGDLGSEGRRVPALMLACYFFAAVELGLDAELVIQKPKFRGDQADEEIIEKLFFMPEKSIIILSLSGKMGSLKQLGRSFRKYSKLKKHKFISISGLNYMKTELFPSIVHSLRVDPKIMQIRGEKLKRTLDAANQVRIITELGTDLVVDKKGCDSIINSGLYTEFGTGGNLPAGEVYFYPEGKFGVTGKVVIDGSIRTGTGTIVLRNPVTFYIENGSITRIIGGRDAKILEDSIKLAESKSKYKENVWKISEIGIGINPNARVIGPTIFDEKTLGTAHLANGSNHWFGGPIISSIHYDHVFRAPKIFIDGKQIRV